MHNWQGAADLGAYLPVLITMVAAAGILWLANWWLLRRRPDLGAEARLPRQLLMLGLAAAALLAILLLIPMSENTRGQILSLVGIVLTGVIALSSTSFIANIMAGLMLRVVRSFRPGDFIGIAEKFGRVTERGLFHTEIQTEDRDLTTFPNFYLATHPVTVVRSSGTIVSASLSLGYDIPRIRVEELLKTAAEEAGLHEPFVHITALNDFSIAYRIAGFLPDVKHLLTVRSDLRKRIIDVLHADGVEIVSPAFMNQRLLPEEKKIIPRPQSGRSAIPNAQAGQTPENLIFDKADKAEALEKLRDHFEALQQEIDALNKARKDAPEAELPGLKARIESREARKNQLAQLLEKAREKGAAK